jgi:ribokinase
LWSNELKNIVVLGSINTDFVIQTRRFPRVGETVSGDDYEVHLGGKGANQAISAARLGSSVSMIARVGNDFYGRSAIQNLEKQSVNIDSIAIDTHAPSGVAFVVIDENGNNSIIVSPGANQHVGISDLEQAKSLFTRDTILITQFEIAIPTVIAGLELAKTHGSQVILNPSPIMQLDPKIYQIVDTVILNETELQTISQSDDIDAGLQEIKQLGIDQIVLTLGKSGCILFQNDQKTILSSYKVKVVDTTGAGDAFIGGFSTALCEGHDSITACKWGNAAGAIATTFSGAQTSLPNRKQIFDLINH